NRDHRGAMVARSRLVGGRLAASRQPQGTCECDGEQHRQEPSHLAPPFTRDRDLMCVRDAMRGEAFTDTTPRQSADATIRTNGHKFDGCPPLGLTAAEGGAYRRLRRHAP